MRQKTACVGGAEIADMRPIIAANWKMHKTPQEGQEFAKKIIDRALDIPSVKFVIFPAATGLFNISQVLKGTDVGFGGQNMHQADEGAFTGEISHAMLTACGADSVIIGHSERRHVFGEKADDRAEKIKTALKNNLQVVHCIGETLVERESNRTQDVLSEQLKQDLCKLDGYPLERIVVAYEPVWAIGTGVVAQPQQVVAAHAMVRSILGEIFQDLHTSAVRVLYGGSVNSGNAAELITCEGINGFLIGGASLDVDEFVNIGRIVQTEIG